MRPVSFSHVIKVESNYLQFGTNIIIDKKIALSIILLHAITKNILVKYFPEPPKLLSWKQNQKEKNESVQMTSYEWFTNDTINYEIVCITIYRCNWHQSNRGKNEIPLNSVDDFLQGNYFLMVTRNWSISVVFFRSHIAENYIIRSVDNEIDLKGNNQVKWIRMQKYVVRLHKTYMWFEIIIIFIILW